MAKLFVRWTETAARERKEILKHWTKRNGSATFAKKLIRLVSRRIAMIQKHPESFKAVDFPNTRESAMGHFSIFYQVRNRQLIITAFWDNRQDPKKLLSVLMKGTSKN